MVDKIKNQFIDGFTDIHTMTFSTSTLNVNVHSKWTGNTLLGVKVLDFISCQIPTNSADVTKRLHLQINWKNPYDGTKTLYHSLSQTGLHDSNTIACYAVYDHSLQRFKSIENSTQEIYPLTETVIRNTSTENFEVLIRREDGTLLPNQASTHLLKLAFRFGPRPKNIL